MEFLTEDAVSNISTRDLWTNLQATFTGGFSRLFVMEKDPEDPLIIDTPFGPILRKGIERALNPNNPWKFRTLQGCIQRTKEDGPGVLDLVCPDGDPDNVIVVKPLQPRDPSPPSNQTALDLAVAYRNKPDDQRVSCRVYPHIKVQEDGASMHAIACLSMDVYPGAYETYPDIKEAVNTLLDRLKATLQVNPEGNFLQVLEDGNENAFKLVWKTFTTDAQGVIQGVL